MAERMVMAVSRVTAGDGYSCALLTGVRCWGDNTYGQMGLGYVDGTTVSLAGTQLDSFSLGAGTAISRTYAGYGNGPMDVASTTGQPIFTSQRVNNSQGFAGEVMGYPSNRLTNEYWFPWYDNLTMTTWLLVANPSAASTAHVSIYIAGSLMGSYTILPGGRVTPQYSVLNGPVHVVSDNNVVTSERVQVGQAFAGEVMGYPANQLTNEYWFPWYDGSTMTTSLVIDNPSTTSTAHVSVYIAGSLMGTYTIAPGGHAAPTYTVINGPVHVVSDINVVTSERAQVGQTFVNELLGSANNQLTNEYWFPWYDDITMTTWLIIDNPNTSSTAHVSVYIANVLMGTYTLSPGGHVTPSYTNVLTGPLHVVSDLNIVTSQRVQVGSTFASEVAGYPNSWVTSEYWFPWYDDVNMTSWLLAGTTRPLTSLAVTGLGSGLSGMAAGGAHTCVLTTSGSVQCWGSNASGELGDGTTTNRGVPVNTTFTASNVYTYGDSAHKHAVTAMGTGESYTYDADGNMITRVEGGVTYTQTFDAENRLVSVTVGTQTTQFVYDGDGNQVKQVNPDGSKTIRIDGVYEEDRSSGGTVTGTRIYYAAAGAMRVNGTSVYYVVGDNLGSAVLTLDSNGNTVGQERYYPFGSTRFSSGSMQTDRLYTGQRSLASLGLMDYRARFYDPYLNRFISPDSIIPSYADPQSLNRFSYVNNDPIALSDPTGHNYCDRINRNNADDCNGGEWRISRSDSLQRLRKQHESPTISSNSPSGASISAANTNIIELGNPVPLGGYLGGLSGPGGEPNSFYVGGYTVGYEGDTAFTYSAGAGLKYNAHYDLNNYEHGTVIDLTEKYELQAATPYTDIKKAGAVLNLTDSQGIRYQSFLGEIVEGEEKQRSTSITLYGASPASMSITIRIILNDTVVTSAPLPVFKFYVNP